MHSLFRTFSFLTLAAAVSARAQMTPPPEPAEHEAVNLDYMVVTAMPFVRNQAEIAAATAVLEGRSLQVRRQGTLGETLAGEVGMASTSFGPGAGRPIIRGLGGDRIRILENGVGTIDASVTSPDHAVSVEPFLVERIEIVRGPASLLYGSSAVGGVVNVITHRIETAMPERRVSGAAELRYGSGANETGFGGVTDIAVYRSDRGALVLHLDGFKRNAADLEIPGFAESARLRAEEAEEAAEESEEAPEEVAGILPNSSVDSSGGAAGLSWVSPGLSVGFAYTGFNTFYGIPGGAHAHEHEEGDDPAGESEGEEEHGEEDVRIDLRQRRVDLQGEWRHQSGLVRALRFKLGRAEYRHQELEGEAIGTVFRNQGYDGRIELLHAPVGGFEGAWGVQATRSDFSAVGDEAFLPPSVTEGRALFVFEEVRRGALNWQVGARYEEQDIELKDRATGRADSTFSGSAGVVWTLSEPYSLAASLTRTERAPNAQELFADGPHVGTDAFEIGDSDLGTETSTGIELSLRRRSGAVTGTVNAYMNSFSSYIFEQPTDEEEDGLTVFRYVQRDVDFWGAEAEAILHLHEGRQHRLDLRVAGDLTRAEESSGENLPRIPPFKGVVGLDWSAGEFAAGISWQRVARQARVAGFESATDGYSLVDAYGTYRMALGAMTYDWFVRGTNLEDTEARLHPSFLKDLAPRGGRAFAVGVRIGF